MEAYISLENQFRLELEQCNKKYNTISFLRLLSIVLSLVSFYLYSNTQSISYIVLAVFLLGVFLFLMQVHSKLSEQKKTKEALIAINGNEIAYLRKEKIPFENGLEFNDFSHPYAYDLDLYGEHSLFQNLNRTHTFIGKKTLAQQLLGVLPEAEIRQNQQAVKELSSKLNWRQEFMALAKRSADNKAVYETLVNWSRFKSSPLSKQSQFLSFLGPALLLSAVLAYLVTNNPLFIKAISLFFVFNLFYLGRFYKRISIEIANADNIDKIIHHYSRLVQKIELEVFQDEHLIHLQQQLNYKNKPASAHLKQLSVLFSRMDSIGNLITTSLFNGGFLFHFHTLKALIDWKNENAAALENWLEVIGQFEMLHSLANFSHNNPVMVFPTLNANYEISFSNLSHPLLNEKTRIGNDVTFNPQSFMILTGSNMSGKSTFLRSLGINMVLAGIGAPVCADKANVHPMPVLVSMRLSDSLSDSESYFYAEIKRLKQIMDALQGSRAFVLLDEILRGTNSDDKRNGTIEVVKKMIAKKALGVIATHDIEVCLTTNEFPMQLTNKCFEVEILNDDLHFDYKLREGICKNKSATFLMKKMGVI